MPVQDQFLSVLKPVFRTKKHIAVLEYSLEEWYHKFDSPFHKDLIVLLTGTTPLEVFAKTSNWGGKFDL